MMTKMGKSSSLAEHGSIFLQHFISIIQFPSRYYTVLNCIYKLMLLREQR